MKTVDERGNSLSREEIRETMEGKAKGCETGLHDCTVYQHAIRVGDQLVSTYGDIYTVITSYSDYENCCTIVFAKPQLLSNGEFFDMTQSEIYRLGLEIYK